MNLSQGGGSQGDFVETGEQFFNRGPQIFLDTNPHRLPRHRWHLILQPRQFRQVGWRQQVGPGAENLAEFDKSWPQLLQRQTHMLSRGYLIRYFLVAAKQAARQIQPASQAQLRYNRAKAVADQNFGYLAIPAKMAPVLIIRMTAFAVTTYSAG